MYRPILPPIIETRLRFLLLSSQTLLSTLFLSFNHYRVDHGNYNEIAISCSFFLSLSLSLSLFLSLSLSLSLSVLYPSSSFLCTCKITAAKEPYVLKLFSRGIRKSIFRLCSRLWFDNRCQAIEPSTRNVVGNAIS